MAEHDLERNESARDSAISKPGREYGPATSFRSPHEVIVHEVKPGGNGKEPTGVEQDTNRSGISSLDGSSIRGFVDTIFSLSSAGTSSEPREDLEEGQDVETRGGGYGVALDGYEAGPRNLLQRGPNDAGLQIAEHPHGLELAARWYWQEQPQHMDKVSCSSLRVVHCSNHQFAF